jgi:hypothetical protein
MAHNTFIITKLVFESYKEYFEVSTDSDFVYIENQKQEAEGVCIKIAIDDWFEIITYIEKQLK